MEENVLLNMLNRIKSRRQKLDEVKKQLKNHFVGLDEIIDKIIQNIEVWYVMPELITRPVVVCLWGLTGVGKTDLVRRLVRGLEHTNNFVEIQLTNKGSTIDTYSSSLQSLLRYSNIDPEETGILLLDEIQRFRSISERGEEIHDYKFQDLWSLLSDGNFGALSDNKNVLFEMLFNNLYSTERGSSDDNGEPIEEGEGSNVTAPPSPPEQLEPTQKVSPENKKTLKYKRSYYSARSLKKTLRLSESIEEIMTWDSMKKNSIIVDKINDPMTYEAENYQKLLIFISGNIDEAYRMSDACEEVDMDADIFHSFSLHINLLTIKNALKRRFKPEQIARFGNTHIIYPSLSSNSYKEIIRRRVKDIVLLVKEKCGIDIVVDQSIYDFIYRNGVFPVQGTRPLFSTISAFLENSLPFFVLKSIENKANSLDIYYDFNSKSICTNMNGEIVSRVYTGDIDIIRLNKENNDRKVCISVHEAGHAVVYVKEFGIAPLQIISKGASDDVAGFVGIHKMHNSYENMIKKISVLMAAAAAEKLVFGRDLRSAGCSFDISEATSLAADIVREYGMDINMSKIMIPVAHDDAFSTNNNYEPTNEKIEHIVKQGFDRATAVLKDNINLLQEVANYLIHNGEMKIEAFCDLCVQHHVEAVIISSQDEVFSSYKKAYDQFCEK